VGVVLFALSLTKLVPLAVLFLSGGQTRAEVARIVRTDAADQETVYTSDAALETAVKTGEDVRDRESVFWVVYRFRTEDGRQVEARAPLGQHVKPLQPLRDKDGLSSTTVVWYDRSDPQRIALPLELGTWFMPGVLVLFGVLGTLMGLMLYRHSKRPIEMPDLSQSHGERDASRS
jgi:hypothetical protein